MISQQMIWLQFLPLEKIKIQKIYKFGSQVMQEFEKALKKIYLNLRKQIVVDGEGAKKFITVKICRSKIYSMAKNCFF